MDQAHLESGPFGEERRIPIRFNGFFDHILIHGHDFDAIFANIAHGTYGTPAVIPIRPNLLPVMVELHGRDGAIGVHGSDKLSQQAHIPFVAIENKCGSLRLEKIFAAHRGFTKTDLSRPAPCLILEKSDLTLQIGQ